METKQANPVDKVPTAPAVTKLLEAFPDLHPDKVVTHSEIERAIDTPKHSPRYQTVVAAWKAALFAQHNVVLVSMPGLGYRHVVKGERVGLAVKKLKRGIVKVRGAGVIASTTPTDGLSLTERTTRDHFARVATSLETAFRQEQRALSGPLRALLDAAGKDTVTA